MKAPYASYPALPAALGIIGGIILEQQGFGLAGAIIGAAAFVWLYFKHHHYASFFALMLCAGAMLAYAHKSEPLPETIFGSSQEVVGDVVSAQERDYGAQIILRVQRIDSLAIAPPVLASVTCYGHSLMPELGATVRCKGKIKAIPSALAIPYDKYHPEWLLRQGINYEISSEYGSISTVRQPAPWKRTVNRMRDSLWNGIVMSPISGECASFLIAAILGDRSFLSSETQDAYRASGTAHILALSGLHVGIIASIIGWLLLPLKCHRRGFCLSLPIVIVLIWAYAIVTGLSPSVTRAAVMLTLTMACALLQRGARPFNALCLAAVIILAFSPEQLYSPGFQLSFAAVCTLLIFARIVPIKLKRKPWAYYGLMMIILPAAAMLGTGLISAYYFHIFPIFFLIANIGVGLFGGPVIGLGMILMVLSMLGAHPAWLGLAEDCLFRAMMWCVEKVGSLNGALDAGYFSAWAFVPWALALTLLALALHRWQNDQKFIAPLALSGISFALAAAMLIFVNIDNAPESELFITNGQNTAIVLRHHKVPYAIHLDEAADSEERLSQRLEEYLKVRCDGAPLSSMPQGEEIGPFLQKGPFLVAYNSLFRIFNEPAADVVSESLRVDIAIVGPKYDGDMAAIVEMCNPATVILSGSVSSSRARRFKREMPPAVSLVDLAKSESYIHKLP